ncbi:hypothetical protein DFH07DRAFT_958683 [Mycena maculata]|uniref:Uncharacterized protein n=1 Tax=Mycena maculata TaxID=230809 RepID=A0AAD7NES6_9AGAR|nr:hypothetical protein DFH07DRAFT_958683 [Mycena maculata]
MLNCFIPHFFHPLLPPAIPLKSISVIHAPEDYRTDYPTGLWLSQLLYAAPRLRCMHWDGPPISAPWEQLTHLSWIPADRYGRMDVQHFRETLDRLQNLTILRLHLRPCIHYNNQEIPHLLPRVATFFLVGETKIVRFLTLPELKHLVIEWSPSSSPHDLESLLERSQCVITCLELQEDHFPKLSSSLLMHNTVRTSLIRLATTSPELNDFFEECERASPGTLPLLALPTRPMLQD